MKATATFTFERLFAPSLHKSALRTNALAIVLGSLYLAVLAQVQIPLYPVPITLQTFGLITLALFLGANRALFAVALYLAEGAMGLPVFAGGVGGFAYLASPTAGFLLGFLPYTWLYAKARTRIVQNLFLGIFTGLLGEVVLFAMGLSVLGAYFGYNAMLLQIGLYPFLLGAVLKSALAVASYHFINKKHQA